MASVTTAGRRRPPGRPPGRRSLAGDPRRFELAAFGYFRRGGKTRLEAALAAEWFCSPCAIDEVAIEGAFVRLGGEVAHHSAVVEARRLAQKYRDLVRRGDPDEVRWLTESGVGLAMLFSPAFTAPGAFVLSTLGWSQILPRVIERVTIPQAVLSTDPAPTMLRKNLRRLKPSS